MIVLIVGSNFESFINGIIILAMIHYFFIHFWILLDKMLRIFNLFSWEDELIAFLTYPSCCFGYQIYARFLR